MGFLHGNVTYARFTVTDALPRDFRAAVTTRLARFAFREIDPKNNPESSIGWVNATNPLDSKVTLEKALFDSYIILGIRHDRKSLPAALYRVRLADAVRAQARERKGRKLKPDEIASVRETLKAQMLATVSPQTALMEMVWNFEAGVVFYSATVRRAVDDFMELFADTFEVGLAESGLVARTEAFIEAKGLSLDISDISQARFTAR